MPPVDQIEPAQPKAGSDDSMISKIAADIWSGGSKAVSGACEVVAEHPVETAALVLVTAMALSKGKVAGVGRLAPTSAFEASLVPSTEKLLAASIPITAESRAAAASGLSRSMVPATEALLAGSVPITAETRAAATLGLRRSIAPATEALLSAGIPITPATRAAAASGLGRTMVPATEALVSSSVPINAESRAAAAALEAMNLAAYQRSAALKGIFAVGKGGF